MDKWRANVDMFPKIGHVPVDVEIGGRRCLPEACAPGVKLKTNNPLERIMREIRRRTRVVGAFPDGQSALNLAAARLRHIAGTKWSLKRYMNMDLLKQQRMTA